MRKIEPVWLAFALLLLGSAGPIGGALFSQYHLGYPPCPLCLWQRYPYLMPGIAAFLLGLPALRAQWRTLLLLGGLGWLLTGGVAAYHAAFEQGWVAGSTGCAAASIGGALADIRSAILAAPLVACNEISLRIFGLSMAVWNLIAALGFTCSAALLIRCFPTSKDRA